MKDGDGEREKERKKEERGEENSEDVARGLKIRLETDVCTRFLSEDNNTCIPMLRVNCVLYTRRIMLCL